MFRGTQGSRQRQQGFDIGAVAFALAPQTPEGAASYAQIEV